MRAPRTCLAGLAALFLVYPGSPAAHEGPPYPIVSSRQVGPYTLSVWTDPDATDDGSAGGQFWVIVERPEGGIEGTHAAVAIRPLDRAGPTLSLAAEPVGGDVANQFAALVMDHEGPYGVEVIVDGPLGQGRVSADVEATYDARPPPYMLVWYLAPFVLLGVLWIRLLLLRRRATAARHEGGGHEGVRFRAGGA